MIGKAGATKMANERQIEEVSNLQNSLIKEEARFCR